VFREEWSDMVYIGFDTVQTGKRQTKERRSMTKKSSEIVGIKMGIFT